MTASRLLPVMSTSFFGNIAAVARPLSISGRAPDWYAGPQARWLAPRLGFFTAWKAGEIGDDGYVREFEVQVLARFDPVEVYARLIADHGEGVTLLCYEQPGEFCHRRLVATWMEKANGVVIPELPIAA